MKKKLWMILVIVASLFCGNAFAQLPQESTNDNPIWYYIQVKGSDNGRELMVWAVEESIVYGQVINTTDQDKIDAQLFRFEKSGDNYSIISKSTNQKVNAVHNGHHYFTVDGTGMPLIIKLISGTPYYNIEVTTPPGNAENIYAHQGNGGYSWKVILTDSGYGTSLNSQFSFILPEQLNLEYSTDNEVVWYTINSAKEEINSKCLTDESTTVNSAIKIGVEDYVQGSDNQLWKLVETTDSKINFINKATGKLIQTKSNVVEENILYNYTQLDLNPSGNKGWSLVYVGVGQYVLTGVEEDDIQRYLNATTEGTAPDEYDSSNLPFSTFAWKFAKEKKDIVSTPNVKEENNIRIYSISRKIVVEGAEEYTIKTIQGTAVNKNIELPVGIYLITANGKTTKLLVK